MIKTKYKKRTIEWIGTTILPFFLVLIVWPIYALVFKKPFNFERVLCTGDLYAICFTVLLSSYAEFSFKQNKVTDEDISSQLEFIKQWSIFLFVISLLAYVVMKIATFDSIIPTDDKQNIFELFVYALTSVLFSIFSILFILYHKLDFQD